MYTGMGDTNWRRIVVAGQLAILLAAPSGCLSQAVINSAGSHPETLALLALTLPLDAIGAAIAAAGKGSNSSSNTSAAGGTGGLAPTPYLTAGRDPDDWRGACSGPVVCSSHEHFVCEGSPGDCECACVITQAPAPACVPATPYEGPVLTRCQPGSKEQTRPGPVASR
jgi:hypothetical protein